MGRSSSSAAATAVMLYLVIVFNRLPNDEFARRIESAGTGRVLRTLALASPGVLGDVASNDSRERAASRRRAERVELGACRAPRGWNRMSRVWGTVRLGSFPRRA